VLRMVSLQPGGNLVISAAKGISVDIEKIDGKTGPALIDALVARDPDMAWLKDLADQGEIDWNEVEAVHERWSEEQESLGAGASAVIAIVVTTLTGGTGTGTVGGWVGNTTGVNALGVASSAVASSAATQLTLGTINNGGKLDRAFSDLGSRESLEGLGVGALTAGLTVGIDKLFDEVWKVGRLDPSKPVETNAVYGITKGFDLADWRGQLGFTLHRATEGLMNAAVMDAVYGGDFSDYLRDSMESQGNDVLSALAFYKVGDFADGTSFEAAFEKDLDKARDYTEGGLGRILAHGLVGGAVTEVTSGDFKTGFVAAGLNQWATPGMNKVFGEEGPWRTAGSQLAGLAGALLAGGDLNTGSWIAKQADSYNRQLHVREMYVLLNSPEVDEFAEQRGMTREEAVSLLAKNLAWRVDSKWNDEQHIMDAYDPGAQALLDQFASAGYADSNGRALFQKEFDYDVDAFDNELMYADGLAPGRRWTFDDLTVFYVENLVSPTVRSDMYAFGGTAYQGMEAGGSEYIDGRIDDIQSVLGVVAESPLDVAASALEGLASTLYDYSAIRLALDPSGYYQDSMAAVDAAGEGYTTWRTADERAALAMLHGQYEQAGVIATGDVLTNTGLALEFAGLGSVVGSFGKLSYDMVGSATYRVETGSARWGPNGIALNGFESASSNLTYGLDSVSIGSIELERITPEALGISSLSENQRLLSMWTDSMRHLSLAQTKAGDRYRAYLDAMSSGSLSREVLRSAYDEVAVQFRRRLKAAQVAGEHFVGYDFERIHHWNWPITDFPADATNASKLFPVSHDVHMQIHRVTTIGPHPTKNPINPINVIDASPQSVLPDNYFSSN